ncbi:MAG: TolC family protein [Acidobacteriaceae bacterium]|jgi:cobalt-zinc-cadmium efflux system outer membrane protein|nr:TolC family protein [Acidobacteriaceae bacterium]
MLIAVAVAVALGVAGPPPPPLTLAQAVTQARTASPLRAAAEQLSEGSIEAARLAGRLPNPLIDVRTENVRPAGSSALPLDVYALVSQPFELAGKRGLRLGVASAERDIQTSNLRTVEWQITARTAQLYVQALKARGLLAVLTDHRDGLATLIETMRRRVEEGAAPEADLLKFETESARMEIDISKAQIDLGRSLTALTFIIGATTPIAPEQLVEPDQVAPPSLDDAAIAAAVSTHPDVRSANAQVARAQQVTALEQARRVPDPVVTAGYKRTNGFDTAVAGVALSVPLFDRNGSAAARALGEERAVKAERDALVQRLTLDATTLITVAHTLAERASRVAGDLLEPADVVRNAAQATFREGTSDILRVIDAERVYSEVKRTAVELRLDALAASVDARLAVGQEIE